MSCTALQRLEIQVSVAISDRNSFAKKLSRQRNDPSQRQLDQLKKLMDEIVISRNNRIEHEATCPDCLAPVERNAACAPSSSTPAASSPATSAPSSP